MKVFVLEIGRPIKQDVEAQLGRVDDVLSIPRAISELEIPKIVAEAHMRIMKLASGGEEVAVVLSGPLALAFELGQAIGLAHAKVIVYQFSQGRYVKVPPLTREHLFEAMKQQ
jgi:phosphoserine phosphatase